MKNYCLIIFMLSINIIYTQTNYFPEKGEWETKSPSEYGYDEDKINDAINYVIKNQNNGNKDLRVEILKGFSTEPYHNIKGPTKKRGNVLWQTGTAIQPHAIIDRTALMVHARYEP